MPRDPDNNGESETGFLQRWSDRKTQAARGKDPDQVTPTDEPPTDASEATATTEPANDDPSVTEADLEGLTYESDYTKFMGEGVPEALRRRALRQLWRSDPILANVDGLCDYDDDFTDAALVVTNLQSAYRVGKGYLTDEEVGEGEEEDVKGAPEPVEGEVGVADADAEGEADRVAAMDGPADLDEAEDV